MNAFISFSLSEQDCDFICTSIFEIIFIGAKVGHGLQNSVDNSGGCEDAKAQSYVPLYFVQAKDLIKILGSRLFFRRNIDHPV